VLREWTCCTFCGLSRTDKTVCSLAVPPLRLSLRDQRETSTRSAWCSVQKTAEAHRGLSGTVETRVGVCGEGIRFANFMNEYAAELEKMGPLGQAEGIGEKELSLKLERCAGSSLRQARAHAEAACTGKNGSGVSRVLHSQEFDRLFEDAIAGKLATSEIMLRLRERPFPQRRFLRSRAQRVRSLGHMTRHPGRNWYGTT